MNSLNHKLCSEEPKFTAGKKNVIFVEFYLQALGSCKEKLRESLKGEKEEKFFFSHELFKSFLTVTKSSTIIFLFVSVLDISHYSA
jgi:hypothetical protein